MDFQLALETFTATGDHVVDQSASQAVIGARSAGGAGAVKGDVAVGAFDQPIAVNIGVAGIGDRISVDVGIG